MRNKLKRTAMVMAVLLAGLFGAVAVESPASAAFSDCPSFRYCLWTGANGTGSRYDWGTEWNGTCVPIGAPFEDTGSSWKNNMASGYWMILFKDRGCTGTRVGNAVSFGTSLNAPPAYDNTASSFIACYYTVCPF